MTVVETGPSTTPGSPSALGRLDEEAAAVLFSGARTVSNFASTPVSDAELAQVWELAKWAPTAANTQPLRVLYVRTDEGRARLVPRMNEGNQAKTASAPVTAILAIDTEYHEFLPVVMPFRPQMRDDFAANDEMRENTGRFSAALQAGYFILAVRAAGLAAGPMAGFDRASVDAEFFPGGRWRSILAVNIGHPGENPWFPRQPRLDHSDVIQWA